VSDGDSQAILYELKQLNQKHDRTWEILAVSTPERGCVIDSIRKHDAQIAQLQGNTFLHRCLNWVAEVVIKLGATAIVALLAKGFLIELLAQAQRVAVGGR
jgi:hypothetical protein